MYIPGWQKHLKPSSWSTHMPCTHGDDSHSFKLCWHNGPVKPAVHSHLCSVVDNIDVVGICGKYVWYWVYTMVDFRRVVVAANNCVDIFICVFDTAMITAIAMGGGKKKTKIIICTILIGTQHKSEHTVLGCVCLWGKKCHPRFLLNIYLWLYVYISRYIAICMQQYSWM